MKDHKNYKEETLLEKIILLTKLFKKVFGINDKDIKEKYEVEKCKHYLN